MNGGLPWPQLRKEMGYFARVTKRVAGGAVDGDGNGSREGKRRVNAVLMGRKTWDSIPEKFRPLKGRVNVVVTRDVEGFDRRLKREGEVEEKGGSGIGSVEGPLVAGSILDALAQVQGLSSTSSSTTSVSTSVAHGIASDVEVEQVFIIGGASIYTSALELPATKRILLTKVEKDFDCDTFFPVNLEEVKTWKRVDKEGWKEATGEEVERHEEQGVGFEFGLWERVEG